MALTPEEIEILRAGGEQALPVFWKLWLQELEPRVLDRMRNARYWFGGGYKKIDVDDETAQYLHWLVSKARTGRLLANYRAEAGDIAAYLASAWMIKNRLCDEFRRRAQEHRTATRVVSLMSEATESPQEAAESRGHGDPIDPSDRAPEAWRAFAQRVVDRGVGRIEEQAGLQLYPEHRGERSSPGSEQLLRHLRAVVPEEDGCAASERLDAVHATARRHWQGRIDAASSAIDRHLGGARAAPKAIERYVRRRDNAEWRAALLPLDGPALVDLLRTVKMNTAQQHITRFRKALASWLRKRLGFDDDVPIEDLLR